MSSNNEKSDLETPKLTHRQQRFIQEYLVDNCAVRAAVRAGYSQKAARSVGPATLSNPVIRKMIDAAIMERNVRTGLEADRVIRETMMIAFSDIRDIQVDDEGKIHVPTPDSARAIQQLEFERTETFEENLEGGKPIRKVRTNARIRMYDKQQALVTLFKHLGLLNPELPPLEVLLNRLPPNAASVIRILMANPKAMPRSDDENNGEAPERSEHQ